MCGVWYCYFDVFLLMVPTTHSNSVVIQTPLLLSLFPVHPGMVSVTLYKTSEGADEHAETEDHHAQDRDHEVHRLKVRRPIIWYGEGTVESGCVELVHVVLHLLEPPCEYEHVFTELYCGVCKPHGGEKRRYV